MAQRKKSNSKGTYGKSRGTKANKKQQVPSNILYEVIVIGFVAVSIFLIISIYFNKGGLIGTAVNNAFFGMFGFGAYFLPLYIFISSFAKIFNKKNQRLDNKIILVFFLILTISIFSHLIYIKSPQIYNEHMDKSVIFPALINYFSISSKHKVAGGFIGGFFGDIFVILLGKIGSKIILILIFISLIILITEQSFFDILKYIFLKFKKFIIFLYKKIKYVIEENKKDNYKKIEQKSKDHSDNKYWEKSKSKNRNKKWKFDDINLEKSDSESKDKNFYEDINYNNQDNVKENSYKSVNEENEEEDIMQISFFKEKNENKEKGNTEEILENRKEENQYSYNSSTKIDKVLYEFPPLDLLRDNPSTGINGSKFKLKQNADKLEQTLLSFGVGAKVVNISCGPTITRYELQPEQGVKVSKILNLTDDIALNLASAGIRIEAPIPGKSLIGIEVPNKVVHSVFLKEVINTEVFQKFPSKIAFALGKDISGETIIADIAKMPHMLISGATGSGKSVCINSIIISILFKAHPDEVKLLMIDPKVVELKVYNGIPHLLIPVVTDPKKAAGALYWAVQEMSERYQLFANTNVRDLASYNKMIEEKGEGKKMPQIVIIVDELADLMQVAAKDVEEAICRLAQMARAAGIHLILATQRPSVDVITGVIKANIPSRIAFAVSSGTDSRTILDMNGAEKLIGKGDMLYYPQGIPKPIRVQGAFITDKEVEKVVDFLKASEEVNYDNTIINKISNDTKSKTSDKFDEKDEYFEQALELVVEKGKASASMIQRKFRVGYNRAARIVDQLHEAGFVGPEEGSKPRKVNITKEEYYRLKQESNENTSSKEMAAANDTNSK